MTVLVVTTVHQSDDPRIRERTIRSLAEDFDVRYAAKLPAPADPGDHEWVPLEGGRVLRWFRALAQMMRREVDVVSLHDHELIPAGLLVRLLRRIPVVVDIHEDAPALIRHLPAAVAAEDGSRPDRRRRNRPPPGAIRARRRPGR